MPDPDAVARHADSAAALLDVPLAADHRPGVLDQLALLLAASRLVSELALPDETQPAPVFRP